jgi:hypothetical protein
MGKTAPQLAQRETGRLLSGLEGGGAGAGSRRSGLGPEVSR